MPGKTTGYVTPHLGVGLDYRRAFAKSRFSSPGQTDVIEIIADQFIDHLTPVAFTEKTLAHIAANIKHIKSAIGRNLMLENISYLFPVAHPEESMIETEFFQRLVTETGCDILLDVTNVYTNSVNLKFDPRDYIISLPLEAVAQVHLAGGYWRNGILIDSHARPVPAEVWELYRFLCDWTIPRCVIIERDRDFPDNDHELLDEVRVARDILESARMEPA